MIRRRPRYRFCITVRKYTFEPARRCSVCTFKHLREKPGNCDEAVHGPPASHLGDKISTTNVGVAFAPSASCRSPLRSSTTSPTPTRGLTVHFSGRGESLPNTFLQIPTRLHPSSLRPQRRILAIHPQLELRAEPLSLRFESCEASISPIRLSN
jgi:hypothetical protein